MAGSRPAACRYYQVKPETSRAMPRNSTRLDTLTIRFTQLTAKFKDIALMNKSISGNNSLCNWIISRIKHFEESSQVVIIKNSLHRGFMTLLRFCILQVRYWRSESALVNVSCYLKSFRCEVYFWITPCLTESSPRDVLG